MIKLLHRIAIHKACFSTNSISPVISEEVLAAIRSNRPVVALESTIISHGMPFPKNLEVAMKIENEVRRCGGVPATVAMIDGIAKVGLSSADMSILADSSQSKLPVMKASRRDLMYAYAHRRTAATTVASTMIFAHRAGIPIFATGGIGGVHRGAETTMDVSADLFELGRTPVTVVCAGIKSILDIPKTLEVLESQGVPVIGYNSKYFPSFYTNNSGILSPMMVDCPISIAKMMLYNHGISLNNGMVVGVPNPSPADAEAIQSAIDRALADANRDNIRGAAITPYLLARVEALTAGQSLDANIALVVNNAHVASEIAREYCKLLSESHDNFKTRTDNKIQCSLRKLVSIAKPSIQPANSTQPKSAAQSAPSESTDRVMVFGGAVIDMIGTVSTELKTKSSNPGVMRTSFGGVGRNIAQAIASSRDSHNASVQLVSAVGSDLSGQALLANAKELGIDVTHVLCAPSTATYTAIHGKDGDLCLGIADMAVLGRLDSQHITGTAGAVRIADMIVVDGNLSQSAFLTLINICHTYAVPVFFEPTSDHKCLLPLQTNSLHKIDIIKPNMSELCVMMDYCLSAGVVTSNTAAVTSALKSFQSSGSTASTQSLLQDARVLACGLWRLMRYAPKSSTNDPYTVKKASLQLTAEGRRRRVGGQHVLVSLGQHGILWCGNQEILGKDADVAIDDTVACRHVTAEALPASHHHIHTNGAGDAFCAGVVSDLLSHGKTGMSLSSVTRGLASARNHILSKR